MNTSEDCAHFSVNLHRPRDFSDDIDEVTSLEGSIGLGGLCVSVLRVSLQLLRMLEAYHGITLPYDNVIRSFDCLNVAWKMLVDLVCSVSTDDDHLPRDPVWVDH